MFSIISYNYIPSKSETIQRVKGNKKPKNAFVGGNGSFVLVEPAKALLTLQDENSTRPTRIKYDAAPVLRPMAYYNNTKLTQRKVDKVCESILWKSIESKDDLPGILQEKWDELIVSKLEQEA